MKPTARLSIIPAASTGHRRSQTIALANCAGIGGASMFEAIAAIWLHPISTMAQPTADPLAAVGAALGVAIVLVTRHQTRGGHVPTRTACGGPDFIMLVAESTPLTPMSWQPVPQIARASSEFEPLAPASLPSAGGSRGACARVAPHTMRRTHHRTLPRCVAAKS